MSPNSGHNKILVVDDVKNVRSALRRSFLDRGWEVETACCGKEALEILADNFHNIVIADYFMPRVNGIEFLKRVNQLYPETFCIMLTAFPFCESIKYAMRNYLKAELFQKPWDDRLLETVERVLMKQQIARCQVS